MAKPQQKGKGPKANPATLSDLVLTINSDGTVTTTVSAEAQWSGIQKFLDPTSNDGAISVGNWNYNSFPGVSHTETTQLQGSGYYRGWSSDFDYDIHLSEFVFVP